MSDLGRGKEEREGREERGGGKGEKGGGEGKKRFEKREGRGLSVPRVLTNVPTPLPLNNCNLNSDTSCLFLLTPSGRKKVPSYL